MNAPLPLPRPDAPTPAGRPAARAAVDARLARRAARDLRALVRRHGGGARASDALRRRVRAIARGAGPDRGDAGRAGAPSSRA